MYDWLIVGAGLTGACLAEQIATRRSETVLVIDRRNHLGGNAYDEVDNGGVLVHRYGIHAFHTNATRVWRYLSRFTDWTPHEHHVLAEVDGQLIPLPFNLNSLEQLFPRTAAALERELVATYGHGVRVPILKLLKASSPELSSLADFVYEKVFLGYTRKQWDLDPDQLSPSVTNRVPLLVARDDRYFQDRYQGIPTDGYTAMVSRMLTHPRIDLRLGTHYEDARADIPHRRLIFTGPIDEYFDYEFGPLPYRSLRFEFQHMEDRESYQPTAQVNFPTTHDYTRILEFKKLTEQKVDGTTIAREWSHEYVPGNNEPYYPIPREENSQMYERYAAKAEELRSDVFFAGRLADYRYYNMDQAVGHALSFMERELLHVV